MIDRKPEIGRHIFEQSETLWFDGYGVYAGIITKISGKRIYYNNKYGKESFIMNFGAVCDTQEEVSFLVEFRKKSINEISDTKRKHYHKFTEFMK